MKHRNKAIGLCLVQGVKRCCRSCAKDPSAARLERHRGVYWLPCSATEHTDGAPLCPNPRTAGLVVEAPISVPDPDATPMQLEESEETRRPKHRALPANVSKEEFDAHQLTHLPCRSWCGHCVRGKAVDDAHRPRIDPHRGGARKGMDHFFLARATDPSHAKAILNCLDFQSGAVFSAMVVKGGEYQRPAGDGEGGARPIQRGKSDSCQPRNGGAVGQRYEANAAGYRGGARDRRSVPF